MLNQTIINEKTVEGIHGQQQQHQQLTHPLLMPSLVCSSLECHSIEDDEST